MEGIELVIIPDDEQLDYNWVTEQFALGGAIWNRANMRQLAKAGITHVVDLQTTFGDTPIPRRELAAENRDAHPNIPELPSWPRNSSRLAPEAFVPHWHPSWVDRDRK